MLALEPFRLRMASLGDLPSLLRLAKEAGHGMTNLPADPALLTTKIQKSIESFAKDIQKPGDEFYFFILEEIATKKVIGCAGIYADVGTRSSFYSFKVSHEYLKSTELNIERDYAFLTLSHDFKGVSEISSLYLSKSYRANRMGEFLARARYLWMAQRPERFHEIVVAEMRGRSDLWGRSPFWEGVGRRFVNCSFDEADKIAAAKRKHYITECLPHVPILIDLLDRRAQACVGAPHKHTRAAIKLLEKEGFSYTHHVDIIDGGPLFEAKIPSIQSVRESFVLILGGTQTDIRGDAFLISNTDPHHFYACVGYAHIDYETKQCHLMPSVLEKLHLQVGDHLRLTLF